MGQKTAEGNYLIDLPDSEAFGDIFTLFDNSDEIEAIQDNQVVTDDGTSLQYEALDEPFIIALLADWEKDQYQIIVTSIE